MKSNKRNQFIILLLLVVYYIFKVYIQDAVIFNAGSGNDRNNINYLIFNSIVCLLLLLVKCQTSSYGIINTTSYTKVRL